MAKDKPALLEMLKAFLQDHKMSLQKFSDLSGISRSTMHRFRFGLAGTTEKIELKLEKFLLKNQEEREYDGPEF